MATLHIVNPSNRETGRYASTRRYVLWFGAHCPTYLMIWERSLEDAMETAGEWLAEHAPGLIMKHSSSELASLFSEAVADIPDGDDCSEAWEQATADLTYTESGYITSYEWGIVFDEGSNRADVKQWIADLEARSYDTPAVAW